MKAPRICRVCEIQLAPPSLAAIRRAEMYGWFFPSRCERCQQMAPVRIARAQLQQAKARALAEEFLTNTPKKANGND
jgi:hypothetical protein